MTSEPTNHDRAGWAREALAVFTATTYGGDHPGAVITRACDHFECELREEVAS